MISHFYIQCLDCGQKTAFHPGDAACPACGCQWREATYDYSNLSRIWLEELGKKPFNMWRYSQLLPVQSINYDLSFDEGGTPLLRAINLGLILGHHKIYFKDERRGPTASFKDRQAAISIPVLKEAGISEAVIASTGNVAIAYSAYAARAGIKLWAFLTSLVPAEKMREVALYGTQVIKVTGSYDQAKQVAAEFARQRGLYMDNGARSIPCIESMKTIAYEICEQITGQFNQEQLTDQVNSDCPWKQPDWYIQSVSGGMGPIGVFKGFSELAKMGLISKIPKIGVVQVEGCAPMVKAWKDGSEIAEPVMTPRTLIATLATGDPGRTYTILRDAALTTGGTMESVSDQEAFNAMHFLAKMEGISVEPAAAVAVAGVIKLIHSGVIKPEETVVINISGHTTPIERTILGDGWGHDVVLPTIPSLVTPEEGLLSAISKVALDRYPSIAIIDDHPDVRRLIRRILQSQDNYELFEAANGLEAIELIKRERPHLIILDLMMPELDGFAVIDAMQGDPDIADIPVIVVTAKELTNAEKDRLRGHIQSLMQKGDFMSDELLEEVRTLLK
jgi:threonine synthase